MGSTRATGRSTSTKETHVGVLSVHASCANDSGLFLVLVERQGVRLDVTMDDLEASLVCDSVAVS